MRYVRIFADATGASQFEDVEVEGELRTVVENVPPVLVSAPQPAVGLIFVEQPIDAADWGAHVAPRRQWLFLVEGRVAITVSTGERREFEPGAVLLAEDTEGSGHLSTPLTDDFAFIMVPTG
jgi:hypothetical protein